jgi:hypothetical protein|tara:strand:+ start:1877 stop:2314 length:438 start_codon:yes stop_codon:yes gene_type:complete
MKTLKSRYNGSEWNNIEVIQLKVSELWASVPAVKVHRGREFYEPIKEDIRKNGLHFPLIVVDATRNDLVAQKKKHKDNLCKLPFDQYKDDLTVRQYTVWGGSNRWNIANELGYKYVDCVIVHNGDFEAARVMQSLHRKPYQGKYY